MAAHSMETVRYMEQPFAVLAATGMQGLCQQKGKGVHELDAVCEHTS